LALRLREPSGEGGEGVEFGLRRIRACWVAAFSHAADGLSNPVMVIHGLHSLIRYPVLLEEAGSVSNAR
jgi:hypothetical protein